MTTIYSVYTNSGCVGRCDAKCHEAKGSDCDCICGGAFHGVGSKIAWEDRQTLTDEELADNARRIFGDRQVRIKRSESQPTLFKLDPGPGPG